METEKALEQQQSLRDLWNEFSFAGKEIFELKRDNHLVLSEPQKAAARTIATLDEAHAAETLKELQSRFENAQKQFLELQLEWDKTGNKVILDATLTRFHHFINHLNGLGDFRPIWRGIEQMEQEINMFLTTNYKIKEAIALEAEALATQMEAGKNAWDELMDKWKAAPFIRKKENNNLWNRIQKARNAFYANKRENIIDRQEEQMQNLDWKMEICEQAEAIAESEDWHETTEKYKALFERWKNIGFVPTGEKNDELWERFQKARTHFYERKSEHYEVIQEEQEAHYEQKLKLVAEAEVLKNQTNWKETAAAFDALMQQWRTTGRVPKEKSNELWRRFQEARDYFYQARREHRKAYMATLEANFEAKQKLADEVAALKDSTDWKQTTRKMNELMAAWKQIGGVPREKNDELWQRFINARNHFFTRKNSDRTERQKHFFERLDRQIVQTENFLKKLETEQKEDTERLSDFEKSLKETRGDSEIDKELRAHLSGLITEIKEKLPSRSEKLREVKNQLDTLLSKKKPKE